MIEHTQKWNIEEYLRQRKRSDDEEKLHNLLKIMNIKLSVEELQLEMDKIKSPLDFLRKYRPEFKEEQQVNELMELLRDVWNETPRTELEGKAPNDIVETSEDAEKYMLDIINTLGEVLSQKVWADFKTEWKESSKREVADVSFKMGMTMTLSLLRNSGMPIEMLKSIAEAGLKMRDFER